MKYLLFPRIQEDLAVMQMVNGAWQVLETPLKFTKTIVCFDVRSFTRFFLIILLIKFMQLFVSNN